MYYHPFLIFINFEQVAANSLVNILNRAKGGVTRGCYETLKARLSVCLSEVAIKSPPGAPAPWAAVQTVAPPPGSGRHLSFYPESTSVFAFESSGQVSF